MFCLTKIVILHVISALVVLVFPHSAQADEYPLDELSRTVSTRGRVKCPELELLRFGGDNIRYRSALTVNPHMVPKLRELEKLIAQIATKHYRRPPRRIEHLGSYNCRRIRGWPNYVSEHGLANAVDISAFRFAGASKAEREKLPRHLRRGFRVSVLRHWNARGRNAVHACFLRELISEVMKRGLFRGVFGPGYPGHANHFHFDMSPWQMHEADLSSSPAACAAQ